MIKQPTKILWKCKSKLITDLGRLSMSDMTFSLKIVEEYFLTGLKILWLPNMYIAAEREKEKTKKKRERKRWMF